VEWFELVAAPVLVGFGGLVVWYVQSRVDLRPERRKVYGEILEPYIRVFANAKDAAAQREAAMQLQTFEYRKTAFDLSLFGADSVVRAYNDMMQYAFSSSSSTPDAKKMMQLWGQLLLEIRKSLGNPSNELSEWDMLRGMITDIDSIIKS
jgi:hypothetical protein